MTHKNQGPLNALGGPRGTAFRDGICNPENNQNPPSRQAKLRPRRERSPIDFAAVNAAALRAFPAVLGRILPSGKQVHREWVALNPRRCDRALGSFKVNRYNGRWCDFATGDKGGDPVSLVAYVQGVSQFEAARLLAHMLGIDAGRRHE